MPRHMIMVLSISPFVLLAACGKPEEAPDAPAATTTPTATVAAAPAVPVAYDCLPAQDLTVSYDNSGATSTATVALAGRTYQLTHVPSGSGARYSTDAGRSAGKTLVWWSKGTDGTLYEGTVGDTSAEEVQIAECSPSAAPG